MSRRLPASLTPLLPNEPSGSRRQRRAGRSAAPACLPPTLPPPCPCLPADGRPLPGRPPVVRDMSIQLPRGATCLLIGPNGAGKTTLLKAKWQPTRGAGTCAGTCSCVAKPTGARCNAFPSVLPPAGAGWQAHGARGSGAGAGRPSLPRHAPDQQRRAVVCRRQLGARHRLCRLRHPSGGETRRAAHAAATAPDGQLRNAAARCSPLARCMRAYRTGRCRHPHGTPTAWLPDCLPAGLPGCRATSRRRRCSTACRASTQPGGTS